MDGVALLGQTNKQLTSVKFWCKESNKGSCTPRGCTLMANLRDKIRVSTSLVSVDSVDVEREVIASVILPPLNLSD